MDALSLKGLFLVISELETIEKKPKLRSLRAGLHNACPNLSNVVKSRYGSWIPFLKSLPELEMTEDEIYVVKIRTFADQLGLLVLADIVRDVNSIDEIEQHVNEVASESLKQWISKFFNSGIESFCLSRPDLFVVVDGCVFESKPVLAPPMEGALEADLS